jgi:hypothetical protein
MASTEIYGFAAAQPVSVSTSDTCETTMTPAKKEAVQGYITRLGPELRQRFGKSEQYTPEQVKETALATALSIDYICWAYVIFCSVHDFQRIHSAAGEVCDYTGMHALVGETFFGGIAQFDVFSLGDVATVGMDGLLAGAASMGDVVDGAGSLADAGSSLFDWI